MRTKLVGPIVLGGMIAIMGAGIALAQPMMGSRGMGPGMMGQGAGPMRGFSDPAAYLDNLKTALKITEAQAPAWNEYATAVKATAGQMQGVHQTMYDSMGTATWQERRDMMNRMFEVRQQSFDTVHAAAEKLLPTLDAAQKADAVTRLPGLAGPHRGMTGRMGQGPRTP
jgi:hypothetical protein